MIEQFSEEKDFFPLHPGGGLAQRGVPTYSGGGLNLHRPTIWPVPSYVLNYDELSDFEWISDFLELKNARARLKNLKLERRKVLEIPILKKDYLSKINESLDKIEERRIADLCQFLTQQRENDDPLQFYQQRMRSKLNHYFDLVPPLKDFQEALKSLPEGEISAKKKQKRINEIDREITDLENLISKLKVDETFILAKRLVATWESTQSQINSPVNAFGYNLGASPKAEVKAWHQLGLEKMVNRFGGFLAAEPIKPIVDS